MAALEQAALSGALFQPRSNSPTRSASTASPLNTDDELGSDLDSPPPRSSALPHAGEESSANLLASRKSAQTGPKGVIEDRRVQSHIAQASRVETAKKLKAEQERRGIIAPTVEEEVAARKKEEEDREWRERQEDAEARAKWRAKRREELERAKSQRDEEEAEGGGRRRGGLKEVGQEGYLMAVERRGWVVVLIYEPDIPRCQSLLASLLSLSLSLPSSGTLPTPISLFRARASSLAFSLLPHTSSSAARRHDGDEEEGEFDEPYEDEPAGEPDPDVLPSLLAYKDGVLEKTWIRVDWEVDEGGVKGLLRREGILPPSNALGGLTSGMKDLLGGSDEDE